MNVSQQLFLALLRNDFPSFIAKCVLTLSPGEPYQENWHLSTLAQDLQDVMDGKITRFIINAPPRSLKSIVTTVAFPAYVLGRDPTKRFICASYANDLAIKHANDFRAIIGSEWYRLAFPSMQAAPVKNTEYEFTTQQFGGRYTTSVGGTLTG